METVNAGNAKGAYLRAEERMEIKQVFQNDQQENSLKQT